jgi:hypothetical protein
VAGTEPHDTCDQGTGGVQGFFSRIFGGSSEKALPPPSSSQNGNQPGNAGVQNEEEARKKKSFFGKIVGVFKGDSGSPKSDNAKQTPAPSKTGDSGGPPQ